MPTKEHYDWPQLAAYIYRTYHFHLETDFRNTLFKRDEIIILKFEIFWENKIPVPIYYKIYKSEILCDEI